MRYPGIGVWFFLASVPLFALAFALEVRWARRRAGDARVTGFTVRDTLASGAVGLGSVAVEIAVKAPTIAALALVYQFRLFDLTGYWWAWIILLFAEDLCYYWFHRTHHEVRVLWATHVNHHSSEYFNLGTALRQSWTSPIVGAVFWLPLGLVGFSPLMVLTAQAWSALQFGIHTEAIRSLGPLEWVLNSPSHHRVHHGSNARYLDRNYAGIFIIWDRLFGTFEPEGEPARYGLTHDIDTHNPVRIAFHEWHAMIRDVRGARRWRDKFAYVFGPPRQGRRVGWPRDMTARRLAAMGGAYGNLSALAACLDDAAACEADLRAFLGDSIGCCGHSDDVVAMIRERFDITVAGNHEHQAVARADTCGCGYSSPDDEAISCEAFQLATNALGDAGRAQLATWPSHRVVELAGGRVLLCHGSPGYTSEFLFEAELDDLRLEAWLDTFDVRGFVCTHSGLLLRTPPARRSLRGQLRRRRQGRSRWRSGGALRARRAARRRCAGARDPSRRVRSRGVGAPHGGGRHRAGVRRAGAHGRVDVRRHSADRRAPPLFARRRREPGGRVAARSCSTPGAGRPRSPIG